MARLYTEDGVFFGIGQVDVAAGRMNPTKIFVDGNE